MDMELRVLSVLSPHGLLNLGGPWVVPDTHTY